MYIQRFGRPLSVTVVPDWSTSMRLGQSVDGQVLGVLPEHFEVLVECMFRVQLRSARQNEGAVLVQHEKVQHTITLEQFNSCA